MLIDEANHIYITLPMYNLIEYGDDYSDISGSLWQFKRDEVPADNGDVAIDNSQSFKYKAAFVGKQKMLFFLKNIKVVVPLKHLRNFWRSSEMPLINCKIHFELNWIKGYILSSAGDSAKFKTTDAKLHVPYSYFIY